MSLFGYPATIVQYQAQLDSWNRVTGYSPLQKMAKVVEEQKLIKNGTGEEIHSIAEIHIEGTQRIGPHDYFEYINGFGVKMRFDIRHIETKKQMGTDNVSKVIIYA
jgi:hypothetical protein